MPAQEIALLAGIAFLGALVFGTTGFGAALVTIPLATHFEPLAFCLALFALMDLANAAAVGFENPRHAVRGELKSLMPMILVGTALGVTLLVSLPRKTGMLALGVFVLLYALYALVRRESHVRISSRWAWLAGFAGGITSTLFGAGGPPYAIYLSHRDLTKEQFRATLGLTTLTSISVRVVAFVLTGPLRDPLVWKTAAFVVPSALAGIYVARHIFMRLSRVALMRAVAVLLLFSGISLLWKSLGF